jgi:hypothetical protein
MGEVERPNPGHGGRANQTRRQMKALKSTFASPDADFHQRASSDELRDTHRPVLGSVGRRPADRRWRPSERSDGTCARFPTRDRCPEGSASSSPRSKLGSSGECLRVPLRWTSEVVADHSAEQLRRPRTRPGAPRCRGREPLGARLQEGTGEARASEVGASRSRSRVASTARAAPGRPYALVSELSRRDAGSTRWSGRREPHGLPHSSWWRAAHAGCPQGLRQPCGDRDGARAPTRSGGDPRTPDGCVDVDRRGCGHRPCGARAPRVEEASPRP